MERTVEPDWEKRDIFVSSITEYSDIKFSGLKYIFLLVQIANDTCVSGTGS